MNHYGGGYLNVLVLVLEQQGGSCSTVVVLPRGLVVVADRYRIRSLDQEVIIDAAMLVVMRNGRPVRRHELRSAQSPAFQDASVMQQHVRHLKDRRRMYAVVVGVGGNVPALHLLQEVDQPGFVQVEVSDEAVLLVQVEAQQRQAVALAFLSKAKDIEQPVVACILQHAEKEPVSLPAG